MKTAPVSEKIPVYDRATGAMLLRWPIDVREMVKSGEYTTTPPEPIEPEPEPEPASEPVADAPALDAAADALAPKRKR